VKKQNSGWSTPYHLGNTLNSDSSESFASISKNGNVYFTLENGIHQGDIYMSEYKDGEFQPQKSLGLVINTDLRESNPFISPDENYLIYVASKPENEKDADLYVTFRKGNSWSKPINLGDVLNTSANEFCPFIHYKQDRIYFTRMTRTANRNIENVYYYEGISALINKLQRQADFTSRQ
jgi:hypothetical protein